MIKIKSYLKNPLIASTIPLDWWTDFVVGFDPNIFFQVSPSQLLSHLYLIDSICKNHGGPFKDLFQNNLVANFAYVFSKVDEKVSYLGILYGTVPRCLRSTRMYQR